MHHEFHVNEVGIIKLSPGFSALFSAQHQLTTFTLLFSIFSARMPVSGVNILSAFYIGLSIGFFVFIADQYLKHRMELEWYTSAGGTLRQCLQNFQMPGQENTSLWQKVLPWWHGEFFTPHNRDQECAITDLHYYHCEAVMHAHTVLSCMIAAQKPLLWGVQPEAGMTFPVASFRG